MYYSLIGFLALLTLLITNHDILLKKAQTSAAAVVKAYRRFLIGIIFYYCTDIAWGILEFSSLTDLLFADTEIYFIAMAASILLWTQYVNAYLEEKNAFRTFLLGSGQIFFVSVIGLTLANVFYPVLFRFDDEGIYHAGPVRYIILIAQIVILLCASIYALHAAAREKDPERGRHLTIGLSGMIMLVCIFIQLFFPYLPLYSIAYMLGSCLLRTFVIENEKEAYRQDLILALQKEKMQLQELNSAWNLAYTDALTGAMSKLAYMEKIDRLDKAIADGTVGELAVVVCDLNGLKKINDTMGHETGDRYIIDACQLIRSFYQESLVYRVGGDEFVVILEGGDLTERKALLSAFNRAVDDNRAKDRVQVAAGLAEFDSGKDNSYNRVFERADRNMYARKEAMRLL